MNGRVEIHPRVSTEVNGLSTGLSPTDATAAATSTPGGRSRRKTSHLKDVPETLELRESLRARCADIASRLSRDVPMTKDELEQIATRALEEADLPEGYLGWMMVMISTEFWKDAFASRAAGATVVPAAALFEACRRLSG